MTIYSRSSIQNFDNWWFWIRKNKLLLDLINEQGNIDRIYLYAKDLNEPKYEYLIKNHKSTGINHLNYPNAFTECFNTMDDVYENINDYNPRHYLIMKINNRRELKNIAINNSPDIDYKGFIETYRECTKEPFNFLTMDTMLLPSDPLRFRKNLFDSL